MLDTPSKSQKHKYCSFLWGAKKVTCTKTTIYFWESCEWHNSINNVLYLHRGDMKLGFFSHIVSFKPWFVRYITIYTLINLLTVFEFHYIIWSTRKTILISQIWVNINWANTCETLRTDWWLLSAYMIPNGCTSDQIHLCGFISFLLCPIH